MTKLKIFIATFLSIFVLGAVATLAVTSDVSADTVDNVFKACRDGENFDASVCQATGGTGLFGSDSIWSRIVSTIIFVIGAISVVMIVIGGLRYVLSGGDQAQTTAAKNTILYAVIGLVVAIVAQAIVSFVVTRLFP